MGIFQIHRDLPTDLNNFDSCFFLCLAHFISFNGTVIWPNQTESYQTIQNMNVLKYIKAISYVISVGSEWVLYIIFFLEIFTSKLMIIS